MKEISWQPYGILKDCVPHLGWLQGSSRGVQQAQCTDGEKPVCSRLIQNSVRGVGGLLTPSPAHSHISIPQRNVGQAHTQSQSCRCHSTNLSSHSYPASHKCVLPNHGGGPAHGIVNSRLVGSRKK